MLDYLHRSSRILLPASPLLKLGRKLAWTLTCPPLVNPVHHLLNGPREPRQSPLSSPHQPLRRHRRESR